MVGTLFRKTKELNDNAVKPLSNSVYKIPIWHQLKVKLFLIIAIAIFTIEAIVYIPAITNVRTFWLHDIFSRTWLLSSVTSDNNINFLKSSIAEDYFNSNDTLVITLIDNNERKEIAAYKRPPRIDKFFDLNNYNKIQAIYDSLETVFSSKPTFIQVVDSKKHGDKSIELIISSNQLRYHLITFSYYFLLASVAIAIIAAILIYMILSQIILEPFHIIYTNLIEFVQEPENPNRIIATSQRKDELGVAQRRLTAIETELQQSYYHQKHLANLGLAVAKINHDMRNILTSAQIISDRLSDVQDPVVQILSPKLIRAISRATHYSQSVVAYSRAQEVKPKPQHLNLRLLIEDIKDTLLLQSSNQIQFNNLVADNFEIYADPDHLYRIIMNLARNSMQAMLNDQNSNCVIKRITIRAGRIGSESIIDIEDTGPGLPAKTKENLFAPFHNSSTIGGTGLGLAICDELVRAHGGHITLLSESSSGTHFEIRLPEQPAQLSVWREKKQTG